jgi:hypothetical protein
MDKPAGVPDTLRPIDGGCAMSEVRSGSWLRERAAARKIDRTTVSSDRNWGNDSF